MRLATLPRLLLLALFFTAGVLLGQVLAGRMPDATGDELRRYLEDYLRLGGGAAPTPRTVVSTLVIYFRYPLLAFLLGFASIGVVLLPCATAAYGFFLSFSVCCFTASFGADGVLLLTAFLTINVGIFNFLPIPALDGCQILFTLIELIIRRPIPQKYTSVINTEGLVLLFALMIFISCKDLLNLFG